MKNKPVRINFRINYCSSEDSEFPVNELTLQSPQAKGWQSKRFSTYPQTIIIQLCQLAYVQKLTFLSHQTKITTKIDIECKSDHNQPWKKLGYTCMQSNMITNYEARQLRTVKLNKQVVILFRFTFHNNFVNTLNVFNQVGLISVSVYGQRFNPMPQQQMKQQGILPPGAILDRQTLDKLRQLQYMRRQAIQNNEFQNAKKIKQQIQKLRGGVNALAILQKEKRQAIKREDYESAKQIYQKMKKIRGPLPRASHSSNDRYQSLQKSKQFRNQSLTAIQNSLQKSQHSYLQPIVNKKVIKNKSISFDQIKIQPKYRNIFDQENIMQEEKRYEHEEQNQININPSQSLTIKNVKKKSFSKQKLIPKGKNDSKHFQKSQQTRKQLPLQCHQYFPVINQLIFENLHSDQHALREEALQEMLNLIDTIPEDEFKQRLFINGVIYSVRQAIDDKIVSILLKTIELFGMMLKQFKPKQNQVTVQNYKHLKHILQKMAQYLGHSHDKLKNQVEDVYIILPKQKITSKQKCIQAITLSQRIDRVPKSIIAKLSMLGKISEKYKNIGNQKQHQDIVLFAKRYLEDRSSQVRTNALQLIHLMVKSVGYDQVINILEDIKPTTLKALNQKVLGKKSDSPFNEKKNSPRVMSPIKNQFKQNQSIQLNKSSENIRKQKKSSPKIPKQKIVSPSKNQEVKNPQYVCEYCKMYDKKLENQTFREIHWFKQCPMITICHQCSQAIQIQLFNQHLLSQCQRHKYYKKCPKCRQAVLAKDFNSHTQKKNCLAAKPITTANRCPLCHQDIHPKASGWIKHLVNQGCPLNRRQQVNIS